MNSIPVFGIGISIWKPFQDPVDNGSFFPQLVLHNLSFFAKNEKWLDEKFFAKNGSRKKFEKNEQKMANCDLNLTAK